MLHYSPWHSDGTSLQSWRSFCNPLATWTFTQGSWSCWPVDWIQSVHFKAGITMTSWTPFLCGHWACKQQHATMTTHIYIPVQYRPILCLLNSKMAWHQSHSLCLADAQHNADEEQCLTHKCTLHTTHLDWWRDVKHHLPELNPWVIFWMDWEAVLSHTNATGKLLNVKKMSRDKHCVMLKNWMMHELVIQVHVPNQLDPFMADKLNRKKWRAMTDSSSSVSIYI